MKRILQIDIANGKKITLGDINVTVSDLEEYRQIMKKKHKTNLIYFRYLEL